AQPPRNRLGRQWELRQLLEAGDRRAGVGDLMGSGQGRQRQVETPAPARKADAAFDGLATPFALPAKQRRPDLQDAAFDDGPRLLWLRADDRRRARLDDPGLLAGDLAERIAEKRLV